MIKEENKRIASLGLASEKELSFFLDKVSNKIMKNAKEMQNALCILHDKLKSVKLHGDFVKMAQCLREDFVVLLDIPFEESLLPEKMIIIEKNEEENKDKEKLDEEDDSDEKIKEALYECIVPRLNKIAYDLGSKGNHKAAYIIERYTMKIEEILK
jgi:hypothetical protein